MSDKLICKRCSRPIVGIIKVDSERRTLGKKSILQANYYDEECYYMLNKERALNDYKKERDNKKTNKR